MLTATSHLLSAISALNENLNGNFLSLPDIILPDSAENLMLSIEIGGENQTGSTTVAIIEDALFKNIFLEGSTSAPVAIKSCNNLNRQSVIISTDITDTNMNVNDNLTTITVTLTAAGDVVFKDHHETSVSNEGDTAKFTYKISCHVI